MKDHRTPRPRVVIAGGSGFIGGHAARAFAAAGHDCVVLSRTPEKVPAPARGVRWDAATFTGWERELDGAAALINLTGKLVNCRGTKANRAEIMKSRVNSVRALAEAARRCAEPPPVWVQAASLAIHGDAGGLWCDETAPLGEGFPVEVCRRWEDTFFTAALPGEVRRVLLRVSFVLGADGGPLPVLAKLASLGLGGAAGSGRQFLSWIHVQDLDRIFLAAVADPSMRGVYNACTAGPVTNKEFMAALRGVLHAPWSPRIPAPAVRLGAWLTGGEGDLALTGRRGLPGRLMEAGFRFDHPALEPALKELLAAPLAAKRKPAPDGARSPLPEARCI